MTDETKTPDRESRGMRVGKIWPGAAQCAKEMKEAAEKSLESKELVCETCGGRKGSLEPMPPDPEYKDLCLSIWVDCPDCGGSGKEKK